MANALEVQQMMLGGTGVECIARDIEIGHSPQLSRPEELVVTLVESVKILEPL